MHWCRHSCQNIFTRTYTQFFRFRIVIKFWILTLDSLVTCLNRFFLKVKVFRNLAFSHTVCVRLFRLQRLHTFKLFTRSCVLPQIILNHLLKYSLLKLLFPQLPLVLCVNILSHLLDTFFFEALINLVLLQLLVEFAIDLIQNWLLFEFIYVKLYLVI